MLRIAIVEDASFERKHLVECLRRYEKEKNERFEILEFSDGAELIKNYPENLDILLMDIMMEEMDGLKAARLVRRRDERVILIFVTSMIQYAIQGYSVNAMDFVVKPVSYTGLKVRIDRAVSRLEKNRSRQIEVRNPEGTYQIAVSDICYLETDNHKVIIHTKTQAIQVNTSLRTYEKELAGMPFFRCHTSFLINLNYVDKIQGNNIWVAGQLLSISRYRRKEFLDAWAAYLGD